MNIFTHKIIWSSGSDPEQNLELLVKIPYTDPAKWSGSGFPGLPGIPAYPLTM